MTLEERIEKLEAALEEQKEETTKAKGVAALSFICYQKLADVIDELAQEIGHELGEDFKQWSKGLKDQRDVDNFLRTINKVANSPLHKKELF